MTNGSDLSLPSLLVGFYGHWWPSRHESPRHLDAYSAFLARSTSFGLEAGPSISTASASWELQEAELIDRGDTAGRLSWFQVGMAPGGSHVPVSELIACGWSVLTEFGSVSLEAVQVQVPMVGELRADERLKWSSSLVNSAAGGPGATGATIHVEHGAFVPANSVVSNFDVLAGGLPVGVEEISRPEPAMSVRPETIDRWGWSPDAESWFKAAVAEWTVDAIAWTASAIVQAFYNSGYRGTLGLTIGERSV